MTARGSTTAIAALGAATVRVRVVTRPKQTCSVPWLTLPWDRLATGQPTWEEPWAASAVT
jgi:hypothetical protein